MKIISSLDNAEIKQVTQLSTAKGRKNQQRFIAEGTRTIATIMQYGMKPAKLYATQEMLPQAEKLGTSLDIVLVTQPVMKKISQSATPSGMLAAFPIPSAPSWQQLLPGIVLYKLSDPGNVGTLIRTSIAMNKKTIVFIDGIDPYNPKVVQASAGTIAAATIYQCSWQELWQHKGTFKLCALVVAGGQTPDKINFYDTLLVIGSEAHGIDSNAIETCDARLTIPMPGKTESLNAAVAGAIALYLAWLHNQ